MKPRIQFRIRPQINNPHKMTIEATKDGRKVVIFDALKHASKEQVETYELYKLVKESVECKQFNKRLDLRNEVNKRIKAGDIELDTMKMIFTDKHPVTLF